MQFDALYPRESKILGLAMNKLSSRAFPQRRLWWLLWLALLLPAAQAAAAWHAVSHAALESSGETGGKQLVHLNDCAQCLAAAAMSGGAPTGQIQRVIHSEACYAVPPFTADGLLPAFRARAYLSRAPPFSPL